MNRRLHFIFLFFLHSTCPDGHIVSMYYFSWGVWSVSSSTLKDGIIGSNISKWKCLNKRKNGKSIMLRLISLPTLLTKYELRWPWLKVLWKILSWKRKWIRKRKRICISWSRIRSVCWILPISCWIFERQKHGDSGWTLLNVTLLQCFVKPISVLLLWPSKKDWILY